MADDPTVRLPPPGKQECPTCGKAILSSETTCSLCGTTLRKDDTAPTVILPPPSAGPLPKSSARSDEPQANLNAKSAAQSSRRKGATTVAKLTPPTPPAPGTPAGSSPSGRVLSLRMTRLLPSWLTLTSAALVLMLLSFFAGRTLVPTQTAFDVEPEEQVSTVPLSSLPPVPPAAQLLGQIITASDIFPIQVYGVEAADQDEVIAALQQQVEELLPGLGIMYNINLAQTPQLSGAVVLEFSVTSSGTVSGIEIHLTGMNHADFQEALKNHVGEWRLSLRQKSEIHVFYPLLFIAPTTEPATFVAHAKTVWPGRYKTLAATPVPVYAQSQENAQKVGDVRPGLLIYVVSSQNGWLGALSPTGRVGYVRQEQIFPRVEGTFSAGAVR